MDALPADRRPVLLSYRTLGLGDLLTAVPALRALRAAFPEHRHVLATPAWLAPLVAGLEAVDVHLPVAELEAPPASLGAVDVAVNLHGQGPQSHRVVRALAPARVIAFGERVQWREAEHEVTRWCRLLAEHGIPADPGDLDLTTAPGPVPDGARGATVLHPGAKSPARRWPADRFAAVARHEREEGRRVVVTGGPDEVELARAVAQMGGLDPEAVLAGRLDVGALLRVVAAADRVVCGDTGVAHVATAVATPSVVLFGPVAPDCWGPPPDRRQRHRVLWHGGLGDPHGAEIDPGLLAITVGEVLVELEALDGAPRSPAQTPNGKASSSSAAAGASGPSGRRAAVASKDSRAS